MKKIIAFVLRLLFGGVFLFSGFVKAVDPLGTTYKVEEYMNVFGFSSLLDVAGWLPMLIAVLLIVMEFMIGALMVLHYYKKPVRITAAFFMTFFTIVTLVDAVTNNVSDCGCFGDAIVLTNWETFWKNIALDIVLALIFVFDTKDTRNYTQKTPFVVSIIIFTLITIFAIRNIVYEPVIDFRPWKIGNKMAPTISEQKPPVTYATYKNLQTGEEKEFSMEAEGENTLMAAYAKDSLFSDHWEYIEGKNRAVGTNTVNADGFSLTAYEGNQDEALEILGDEENDLYMLAVWNMEEVSDKGMKTIRKYIENLSKKDHTNIIIVTASTTNKWLDFQEKYDLGQFMFYSCDDKAIKAMIRANPGLVHLNKGIVKEKYSWRSLPQ